MIAVLYPRSDQITGVVRASSLVYIGVRLTFAALIVAFGTWTCCGNGIRATTSRGKQADEAEAEVVETLVEVDERGGVEAPRRRRRRADGCRRPLRAMCGASRSVPRAASPAEPGADLPFDETTGPTTGLHVPRRTHRRVAAAPQALPQSLDQPDPLARAHDPRLRNQAADHQGMLRSPLRPGGGLLPHPGQGLRTRWPRQLGLIPVGLAILSLILINAQGVTALTSERDTGALDLLLVTELSPGDFIYGKL